MDKKEKSPQLSEFYDQFRAEVRAYMAMYRLRQRQMADAAGVSLGLVHKTLKSTDKVSEHMIQACSENIEAFRGTYSRYLRLKIGKSEESVDQDEAVLITRAEKVERITEKVFLAQQEVLRLLEELRQVQHDDNEPDGKVG